MALPSPIMVSWRGFMPWPAAALGVVGDGVGADFIVMGGCTFWGWLGPGQQPGSPFGTN